ncbi:hypothetical protein GYMLUDRAFT_158408 [Collybiopsis luxurians FD-317 M1]|nr:hypothetical protein GYMLUDRAFT_158408 [Collybiopsis luxurians FD-317 M1]
MDIKKEYTGEQEVGLRKPVHQRPEFWVVHPWQKYPHHPPLPLAFPPDDLMLDLVNLYFLHVNQAFPFVHRPSFFKGVTEGLHHRDRHFGALVIVVSALGARYSNDSRVLETSTTSEHSIGWKWVRSIQPLSRSFLHPTTVNEIQMLALYTMFMGVSSTPEIGWVLLSTGVRLIQDAGAHRMTGNRDGRALAEYESWKRAVWMMYTLDLFASAVLGRPSCMKEDDFDVDLPLECDDEFWDPADPQRVSDRPQGDSSTMTYWICYIKLMKILGAVLRAVYPVKRSEETSSKEWNERVVAELDSMLNKWTDEIPEHLRWDPALVNHEHYSQSVMLYATYYWIQIVIHRPFIPRPAEDPPLSFPSLAICANAARSCLHVVEAQQRRKLNLLTLPNLMVCALRFH